MVYLRIEWRDLGPKADAHWLKEILLNWEYNGLRQFKLMNDRGDANKFFEWLLLKLPLDGPTIEEREARRLKKDHN